MHQDIFNITHDSSCMNQRACVSFLLVLMFVLSVTVCLTCVLREAVKLCAVPVMKHMQQLVNRLELH